MSVHITYRVARPDDSRDIARFMCIAGGGLYEFLFDDLIPFVSAVDLLSSGIGGEHYPISYRNCCVASHGHDGEIVAAANVFPADVLKEDDYVLLGSERHNHIRPMLELHDWGRMFLNSLPSATHIVVGASVQHCSVGPKPGRRKLATTA